jgi:hypothetical protein
MPPPVASSCITFCTETASGDKAAPSAPPLALPPFFRDLCWYSRMQAASSANASISSAFPLKSYESSP